ncbi:hemolysin family protein [Uliginosibacterium paludis]|uniref:Hemolysin family protein n=1 Tax=Uliginosibacterium paludis TaxID=1615952 RepID=A0ABV2CV74_9RHOO
MTALWILVLLIAVSGLFSLAEMAFASARRARLVQMAEDGDDGAVAALAIKEQSSRLLAATQTGITAAALLMGVYGESALTTQLETWLGEHAPGLADWNGLIAFTCMIVAVTAASIVFGEIVPKRIALAYPERLASSLAPLMGFFIRALSPAIYFLSFVADRVIALLPVQAAPAVTSMEDILAFVTEGERTGSIQREESHLLGNVVRLEDWRMATIMTPVSDVVYVDLLDTTENNLKRLVETPHSQLPVCKGDVQQVIGIVQSHDILKASLEGEIDFGSLPMDAPLFVPSALTLGDLLRTFRQRKADFAFVVSEFGLTEGVVTLGDLMTSLVGDMMPFSDDPDEALAVERPDGSWLLDGLLPIDEMRDKLGLRELPLEAMGSYHTVGGFMLASLGHIPRKAERFSWEGWVFEVVDIDRNRVDQVLASRAGSETRPAA